MIERHAESFIDILTFRAAATPNKIIYRFLERGETESGTFSYERLRRKSQAIAARLQTLNAGNKRALLLYEPGLDYIAGFYGCLYAGVVAVPAYPPRRNRSDARLLQLFADAKPEFILTSSRMKAELELYLAEMGMPNLIVCLSTDDLPEAMAQEWRRPPLTRNSIAFLQYSSGSTSSPRGVVISHGNLLHNSSLLRDAFAYSPESVCVSWLPVFHDMGLIGSVLQPIHGDFPCILMSPMAFLESPYRWLNAISKYRARLSGAPNFAYELCARAIGEERNSLDLSSWEVAFNGAEPVRSATLQRFAAAFAPCGFRPAAFLTCYGLAEATLIVSGKKQNALPRDVAISKTGLSQNRVVESATDHEDAQILTGCGMPAADQKVVIVNPETHLPCPEDEVGEIWVSGASVASGYWNKNEETQRTFRAYLADSQDGPYLRTGDLGFLHRGELVVTGRLKDLIILRGRNYYPQDIEATAESSHRLLRRGSVAAFAIDSDDQERLVILQEAKRQCSNDDLPQMVTAIRRAVAENHGLIPHTVAILAEGSVLKTSSGKIRRYACREAFLKGKLKILAINKREEELEICAENVQSAQEPFREQLKRQIEMAAQAEIAKILGVPVAAIDANSSLAGLGIDSLGAVQLARSLERQTGVSLPLSDILQPLSLRELAAQLAAQLQHGPQKSPETPHRVIAASTHAGEPIALSYGQEQLWLIQKLHPDNCAYNEGYAVSISGELNTDALNKSFREVIRRHQILRTVFRNTENSPRQFVLTDGDFEMPVLDLPSSEAEEKSSSLVKEICSQLFHLETGPLMRARLLRFTPQNHLLVVVLHHLVCDGLSMEVLKNELSALYRAYKHNGSSPLPALSIQYGDYASWQRQRLAGEAVEHLLQYWRKQLAGMAALELATDYPRPAAFSYRGAVESVELGTELQTLLKEFSRQEGVTLFATLLSTFQVLLGRYTQQWDIPVGSPAANRSLSEIEGLIGLFMNPLVLRARFDRHKSFRNALHEVRKVTLEAFAHQELPFQLLVQDLDPNRNLAANPLFQVLFALQSGIGRDLRLEGLQVTPRPVHNGTAKFDLSVYVGEAPERLSVRMEYSSDLFSAERMKRMLRHWQRLMEAAMAAPERRVSELPLMPPEEERQLLLEWNNTGLEYDETRYLHQLIEDQAFAKPHAIAIVSGDVSLTYYELNSQANRLARYLQKLGVAPDVRVGICLDRRAEMMPALLGIMKAGGAYVPLDPEYPSERLEFMLEDSNAQVLVTDSQSVTRITNYTGRIVKLDRDSALLNNEEDHNFHSGMTKENLAYVIYTSGSTGKPKGVCVSHANLMNFCCAMDAVAGQRQPGNWLSVTSISFDISIYELLWSLARGFTVKLADARTLLEASASTGQRKQIRNQTRPIEFSLFYFAAETEAENHPYRLLLDGAKFADSRGFTAVWTPERHFHPFGGIYPNPSVCGAALAAVTERIQIRAGSVVLPLQNPLRVAEEWSVVDNLSGGRIGISFASGWQPNDFVLAPEAYASRKERMLRGIETVRKLWRGETVVLKNGAGVDVNVGIHPCPVQPELPFWITAAGTPETFRIAGELGANLLTHLLGQNIQQLAENIRAYRDARRTHGHAGEGHVTLMIHTYLGTSLDSVREKVRIPFSNYLVQAVDLGRGSSKENPTQEDREAIIEHAFNRYFENSGLMGTVASCLATIEKLKEIEVDEVACLIDFGVDYESMMASLELVDQLRIASNPATPELPEEETILRFQPTHFQCTPSMAAMFLNDPRTKDLLVPMQRLFLGGELLPASTVHELQSITSAQLYNMYGPTETTIWSAVYKITGNIETSVPIGRPIANTEIYILDQSLNPLPAGIPGELYIGGAGVARAYLGRPELTAERFIPNSFGHKLGTRLYRTGDIARWQHDGNLEFLGRIDQQVKLLGHRIELGEIENALAMLSDVHQCAVVLREDRPSERRLVAYVVPEPGKIPGRDELKSYLKARLPEYMIPSMYVSLPEMPQTPNGKIDRKALPAPEEQTDIAGGTAPRNPTEEMLWGMWVETLNINRAGIHDDFFDLGGQSLLAMQVVARVRNIFQIDLPLRALFENRTIAGLAEYINRTRDQQHVALPPLGHAARETDPPLSYAQQRLWFLDQLEAHSAAYNMSFGCCLSGELDTEILYISLNEIVRRHEVLRTSFPAINGKPTQRISRDLTLPIDEVDLSSLPREEREKEIQLLIRAESAVGFDLAQGPLLRVKLVRSAERKHVLLLTMHHIVGDGWSSGIMLREFSQLYAAYIQGNGSPLPELKLQYTDFAIWQRDWLQGQLLAGQTSYWRQQLAETEPLELPLDYTRPAIESNAGAMLPWTLPDELSTELRTLTRKEGVTLFMTLLAGFQLLLSRYSGQNDISIGTPIAGRRWLETEDLVGFFVNTLVLRTQLDDDFSFVELLHRVRQITLDAYQHQDVPFEKLVEELHPERDLSRSPLFQVMLAFENVLQNKMDLPGLTLTQIEVGSGLAKFDLLLRVDDVGSTVQGALIYRTELFAESTMQRLLTHFTNLLADAVAHSQKPIRELALLSSAEQQQLLEWNQTRREYPFYCMHELFEAQARQVPTATAIEDRGEYWSYRDLNCRANQLARYLKRSGIGPEMRVGICMRRGAEMVIGLLGILKAGAAYVPVDPSYPEERLRFMLDDAQAQVLLTEGGLRKLFPDNQVLKICVDEEAFEIAQEDGSDLGVKLDPRNLAYVIYTSGSTGKPKGAAIMHRAASVLMHWAREVFTNEELRGVLASTSICFDLSVFEIFVPLSWGGRVVMAENALSLPQWLGQENITLVNTVPSAMAELVRIKGVPSSVRVVNLAGEALQRNLVEQIYGLGSIQRIFNLYGPSEDTTYSTYACASRRDSAVNVSIGKPISNTRAYVLDQGMRLVPVGARGELWLAGAGLARGYLNQPALTAERFLPNLFSLTGGERLYRTGDLVRWTQEGTLEFLGRLDHQIKLRGYRIEMGEIEATLLGCPGVEHAVVLVRPGGNTTRLVAYVVFQKPRLSVTMVDLRNQLKKKLPEYMVPTAWVELEQLPLTVNGKVDRKSLPAPQIGHEELGDQAVSSTAVEELLLGIWQQVLGCERISVQDNFFQLGGHSLLVTQMLARVRSTFGVDLPLRRVFEDGQTISALAQLVEEQLRSGKQRTGPPDIKPAPQTAKARLSYAQQRLWFLDRLSPDNPFYNIAARVQLKGELHKNALRQSLKEVVQRHHALRTKIETSEGQPMQIVMTADEWDLQEVDLTNLGPRQSRELETLAETEARHPFRLEKGALLRATLVTVGTAEHVLLITMHHIVSDGWSLGLLVEEVSSLYQQIVNGQSMQLPELPVQYTDYALWQREWMEGDILQEQLGYWCKQLAGIEPLELPLDHERPVMPSYRGGQIIRQFSPELAAGLKNLGRNSDVTLFMVLLAGYQIMLQRYTGRSDLVIGTPVANRTRPELERLIGFFVNMLVLRTSLDPDLAVANLLTRIRGVCLDAYAHQDLPFEKLVEELAPERDISRNPLFQVVLALQNAPARILHLQGLEVTVHPANTQSSRFDLALLIEETQGALKAALDYNADIFEPNTVERMLGHFEAVLQGMVDDPHCLIQDLPMLSQSERLQLLIDWNSAASGHELCIPELFAQQAKRFGTAIALVCGENRMTYEQLDLQSNRVANYLRSFGVAPEVAVGILLQRSIETIVAILGILKAGGTYVPLDPAYPEEHLHLLIKDANVRVLITASHIDKPVLQQSQAMVLNLNVEKYAIHKQNATAPAVPLSPENLAYVMYTSGSTGIPKGVAVTHRGVVRLVHHANYVHFGPEEVVLHVAPLAFDASTFEVWGSLLNGGRLAILASEHPSLEELTATIQSCGVTTAFLTAGLFHLIADRSMPTIQTMQQLLAGGDVVSASHVQRFLAAADGATFVNGYGPTENTTFTACYRVQDPAAVPAPLPIGKPLNQTQVYVLDPQMQLVPVGAIGELYTGGSGLARGYVGQPQLTAEKFVPNPFSSIPGTRLYRTGDLVRYRTDGNLDFLGRADHQVKVRGHRIELGGIEAVLRQQEGVQDCVVTVRGDGSDKRLIAYVVPDFGQDVATANRPGRESWQTALKRKLPEFMVPVAWIELESLPLTPNGKIDRKALPEPGRIETEYIAPRTPLEETLAAIWAEVLKVDKPGIKDNFFDLGGHSLLATQIISRVRETFHVDVPVRNLFEAPTIENLSKCVSSLPRVDSQESDLHAISRETYQGLQPDEVPEVLPN